MSCQGGARPVHGAYVARRPRRRGSRRGALTTWDPARFTRRPHAFRADQITMARRVLVPIDESEHAEYAFRWALNNIFRDGDIIYLAIVGDVPMTYSSPDRA